MGETETAKKGRPPCPKCGKSVRVVKNGVHFRGDRIEQIFRCGSCNSDFMDPGQKGTETQLEPELFLEIKYGEETKKVRPEMMKSLLEMYQVAGRPSGQTVPSFFLEMAESPIADFRRLKFSVQMRPCERRASSGDRFRPPAHAKITPHLQRAMRTLKSGNIFHLEKLTPEQSAELVALSADRDISRQDLVKRFGISQTTLRRHLREARQRAANA